MTPFTRRPFTLTLLLPLILLPVPLACRQPGGVGGPTASASTSTSTSTSTNGSAAPGIALSPDDPAAWVVDETREYDPVLSPPAWVVPSPALPPQAQVDRANNNCAICFHDGRLFFAWRTAPNHFASSATRMYVISSADQGQTWTFEHKVELGTDVREPSFLSIGGALHFHYFEGGSDPFAFEPRHIWRTTRAGPGAWSPPVPILDPGEVPWDMKVRGGKAWLTSYKGDHYGGISTSSTNGGAVELRFRTSADGVNWQSVDPGGNPAVYSGGVSEVGFELDRSGELWAVTRNEDGDASGFGSHLVTAPAADLARWSFPPASNPERYDSPKMIRHGKDLYLLARRDLGGPFDLGLNYLPFEARRLIYWGAYSARPKRSTLYKIDRASRRVVPLLDLPGNGDTAFPSVWRTGAHTFLVANYTSPLGNPDRTWIHGQVSPEGTQIYFLTITFVPRP